MKPFKNGLLQSQELTNWFGSEKSAQSWYSAGKVSGLTVIDCDSVAAVNLATKLEFPPADCENSKGVSFYFLDAGVGNFPGVMICKG